MSGLYEEKGDGVRVDYEKKNHGVRDHQNKE